MNKFAPYVPKSFFYQFIAGFIIIIVIVVILGGIKLIRITSADATRHALVEPVTVFLTEKQSWPVTFSTVGNLSSVKGVTLTAQESGIVKAINFVSGQRVEKDYLLVALDTNEEKADLVAAQASEALATANLERITALKSVHANSKAEYEAVKAEANKSKAEVDKIFAKIARKEITAPFSGDLGISDVKLGQFIDTGTEIVSLDSHEELFLDFAFPQDLIEVISLNTSVSFTVDGISSKDFSASIVAIDNHFDVKTRQVKVRALVKNYDNKLRSGMYARIKVESSRLDEVVVVPSSSVKFAPYGNSVFVVENGVGDPNQASNKDSLVVRQQLVQLGRRKGDFVAVTKGLGEGIRVVNSGTFKLRPGSLVKVVTEPVLRNEYNPNPANS